MLMTQRCAACSFCFRVEHHMCPHMLLQCDPRRGSKRHRRNALRSDAGAQSGLRPRHAGRAPQEQSLGLARPRSHGAE